MRSGGEAGWGRVSAVTYAVATPAGTRREQVSATGLLGAFAGPLGLSEGPKGGSTSGPPSALGGGSLVSRNSWKARSTDTGRPGPAPRPVLMCSWETPTKRGLYCRLHGCHAEAAGLSRRPSTPGLRSRLGRPLHRRAGSPSLMELISPISVGRKSGDKTVA